MGMPVVAMYLASAVTMCSCGKSIPAGKRVSNHWTSLRTVLSESAIGSGSKLMVV